MSLEILAIRPPPILIMILRATLLGHRMSGHIFDSITHTRNSISLSIGNFNSKFVFNSHHNLHSIKRIQTQVISEFGGGRYFGGVNFIKVFDYGDDSFLDFGGVKERLDFSGACKYLRRRYNDCGQKRSGVHDIKIIQCFISIKMLTFSPAFSNSN